VTQAVQVTGAVCEHGEGPVWSAVWPGLRWVDMLAGDVLALAPDGGVTRRHLGTVLAALRPRAGGGMAVALERQFALPDADGTVHTLGELWADPSVRMNDGAATGTGAPHRRLRLPAGPRPVRAAARRRSGRRRRDPGRPGHRRRRLPVGGDARRGRGAPVPADGRLDGQVELPVSQVTACTFGGPRLDQLYITTSRLGLPRSAEAAAGALFRADVGLPAATFAG
jgi:sugar lactone lactonase YvrE